MALRRPAFTRAVGMGMTEYSKESESCHDDSAQLIRLARSGDANARSQLFVRVLPRLQQYLIPRIGPAVSRHTDMDDVCQEVLLRGIKAIHSLREDADFKDFERLILQHAKWQVVDSARAEDRFEGESNVPGGVMSVPADLNANSGEVILIEREQVEWLHSLILKLSDDIASVLWLRIDGLTTGEIAQELGISQDLVRKRHQRGVAELRHYSS